MLAVVALGLLLVATLSIGMLGVGIRTATYIPGIKYVAPLIGVVTVITAYCLFVRIVERRPTVDELGARGWLAELGLGVGGGFAMSFATFAILGLGGAITVFGFNPPRVLLSPFIVQLCTAIILEVVICGLGFRLVERWLGTWITLLMTMIFFGAIRLLADNAEPLAVLAVALDGGLLFAILYMVTRRLWAAIGLHAGWKFAQIALYGEPASASGPHGLVLARVEGPDWLTGGLSGTVASVPALVVTGVVIVALLAVAIRRGRIVRPVWQRGRTR